MKSKIKLTASLENYMEQIYALQQEHDVVRVTDVANALNHSKPSVNRAINTLMAEGFLIHEHYGTLELTDKGVKVAENIHENYRILMKFLVDLIGVEEETANKESRLMAHVISKETRKKLKKHMKKVSK